MSRPSRARWLRIRNASRSLVEPVSPVRVLDGQDHGPGLSQLFEQDEHLLEQPRPGLARVSRPGGLTELREEPGELPGPATGQQRGDAVRAEITDQLAEHRGERGERQAVHAEFHAPPGQHPHALAAAPFGEVADQAGLADPRLAADQHGGRVAPARLRQRRVQHRQLAGPADQDWARYACRHTLKHASRHRHPATPATGAGGSRRADGGGQPAYFMTRSPTRGSAAWTCFTAWPRTLP